MKKHLWMVAAAAIGSALAISPAWAVWPQSGRGACEATGSQQQSAITSDGAGGAIVTWQDLRTPTSIIAAQHLRADGELDPAWPHFGRAVLGQPLVNPDGGEFLPQIVSDGAGGAIVVFIDGRSAVTELDVYAQHILANSTLDPAWPAEALAVSATVGQQEAPVVASDGAGGAIVAWIDTRAGGNAEDIYAQHVLVTGVVDPAWTVNGAPVCTATGTHIFPVIVSDGAGGAVITWSDERGSPPVQDIYAQRILGTGVIAPGWPVNGRVVCGADGGQTGATLAADGVHGAILSWTDARTPGEVHIFAHHVRGDGTLDPVWPVDGRLISGVANNESRPRIVSDGAGGAVVAWQGFTLQTTVINIFAQHVRSNGTVDPAWPAGGRALSSANRVQTHAEIATDGAGGAIVAWDENTTDVFAQHVLASGALDPAYPERGRPLCTLPSQSGDPAIVATPGAGAIVSWTDGRNGNVDIFAMQVQEALATGVGGSTPPPVSLISAFPNPASASMTLRFVLPGSGSASVAIYDVTGRRVRTLVSGTRPAGENALAWDLRDDSGRNVSAGVYFARLASGATVVTQKLVKVK